MDSAPGRHLVAVSPLPSSVTRRAIARLGAVSLDHFVRPGRTDNGSGAHLKDRPVAG